MNQCVGKAESVGSCISGHVDSSVNRSLLQTNSAQRILKRTRTEQNEKHIEATMEAQTRFIMIDWPAAMLPEGFVSFVPTPSTTLTSPCLLSGALWARGGASQEKMLLWSFSWTWWQDVTSRDIKCLVFSCILLLFKSLRYSSIPFWEWLSQLTNLFGKGSNHQPVTLGHDRSFVVQSYASLIVLVCQNHFLWFLRSFLNLSISSGEMV